MQSKHIGSLYVIWNFCSTLILGMILHYSYHNPTLVKCGGEAQHLEKLGIWSPPRFPNV
jgi:hypothetical protein